jgi:hypothetical protein
MYARALGTLARREIAAERAVAIASGMAAFARESKSEP